jgi:Protein prenyltransferase alpha subunit repeat
MTDEENKNEYPSDEKEDVVDDNIPVSSTSSSCFSVLDLFIPIHDIPITFSDLTPIGQNDVGSDGGGVAQIDYEDDFIIAHDYIRALLHIPEITTQRALRLSATCLRQNPANYTIWYYRRQCLYHIYWLPIMNSRNQPPPRQDQQPNLSDETFQFLQHEMLLSATLGGDNPKNYQIWYHRRALLEQLDHVLVLFSAEDHHHHDSDNCKSLVTIVQTYYQNELNYIATVLEQDGKNYHAWSYRQWLIQVMVIAADRRPTKNKNDPTTGSISNTTTTTTTTSLYEQEIIYIESLIEMDHRNNSAWNHRWFISHQRQQHEQQQQQQQHEQQPPSSHEKQSSELFPPSTATTTAITNHPTTCLSPNYVTMEMNYGISIAQMDPYNESPFRYCMALIKEQINSNPLMQDAETLLSFVQTYYQQIRAIEKQWKEKEETETTEKNKMTSSEVPNDEVVSYNSSGSNMDGSSTFCSVPLTSALIDMLEWMNDEVSIRQASEYATQLAHVHDPIRCKYWNYRIHKINKNQSINQ